MAFLTRTEFLLDGTGFDDNTEPLEPPTDAQLNEFSRVASEAHADLYRALLEEVVGTGEPGSSQEGVMRELMEQLDLVKVSSCEHDISL